jgi:hypothetical protein
MTWDWDAVDAIDAHIRAAIRRSDLPRKAYDARVQRMARAASLLISGKSVRVILDSHHGVTLSEFYGALWILLVADVFRDSPEGSGFFGAFLNLTTDDWRAVDAVMRLLHERYFGVPPLPIAQPWEQREE